MFFQLSITTTFLTITYIKLQLYIKYSIKYNLRSSLLFKM